jgi:hypothetical protein
VNFETTTIAAMMPVVMQPMALTTADAPSFLQPEAVDDHPPDSGESGEHPGAYNGSGRDVALGR